MGIESGSFKGCEMKKDFYYYFVNIKRDTVELELYEKKINSILFSNRCCLYKIKGEPFGAGMSFPLFTYNNHEEIYDINKHDIYLLDSINEKDLNEIKLKDLKDYAEFLELDGINKVLDLVYINENGFVKRIIERFDRTDREKLLKQIGC